ncbi:DUF1254 domain-containing protein [Acinetobacter sp. F16]|uniref:DUF1254 domain-containing protein n=1 Tax=Acinetobacter sp. F16 TaxID=3462438 RepID=UPI004046A190
MIKHKMLMCAMLGISLGMSPAIFAKLTEAEAVALVKKAYIFGYPVVDSYRIQYSYFVNQNNPEYKGAWNELHNVARVFTPKDVAIQTPNSDTPYSFVGADLRTEPLVLSVPKIDDKRYYSIQFIDMYTHNFAYVGSRATGNEAGHFLLVGPAWKGTKPANIKQVIRSESDLAFLLYRTQLFSDKDIENVKKIQSQYKVTPLSQFQGTKVPKAAPKINFLTPLTVEQQKTSPEFFNVLNFALQYANVHPSEKAMLKEFEQIGIKPGQKFELSKLDPVIQAAIPKGMEKAWQDALAYKASEVDTGEISAADGFGTRKFLQGRYLDRMLSAAYGIYGNSKEEALYPAYFVDAGGKPLDGNNKYQLTFPKGQLPPVKSFWSLTMYKLPESLLYDNELNRYLINSSITNQLVKNKDGSVTLYLQNATPDAKLKANWLPAPKGPFISIMRLYWPEQAALNGSWKEPKLIKVNP